MREERIVHEVGDFWVYRSSEGYTVMRAVSPVPGVTYSASDSTYALTDDGLSLARARCDYLAKWSKR